MVQVKNVWFFKSWVIANIDTHYEC